MKAASSGMLDDLTKTFKGSDGSTEKLVKVQQDNLGGDFKEFQSAWEAVGTDLFDGLDSSLRSLTQSATKFLLTVDGWIKKNSELAGGLAKAAVAGTVILGVLGAVGLASWPVVSGINGILGGAGKLRVAFAVAGEAITAALGAVTLPVALIGIAIVAGALLIRKYWEPIKAFIAGAAEGFTAAMGPISESFGTLKPIFNWLSEKIEALWNWFGKLLEPVKSTQKELESAGDMGRKFGNLLTEALKIPGHALDQLRSGIDWVLEKLGVIDTKSTGLADKVPQHEPVTQGDVGYVYPGMQYNMASAGNYRPVTTPAAGGYTDNSQNHSTYEINMHPGMSKDDALALIAQDRERQARTKRAQQQSKMGWED